MPMEHAAPHAEIDAEQPAEVQATAPAATGPAAVDKIEQGGETIYRVLCPQCRRVTGLRQPGLTRCGCGLAMEIPA